MKAIINFKDHTVGVNGVFTSFHENGLYENSNEANFREPECEVEFKQGDYDNYMVEKGFDELEYIEKDSTRMAVVIINDTRNFVNPEEIETATIGDMKKAGWDNDWCGIWKEGENEDGETLYMGYDFDGLKTLEEVKEIKTDWRVIKYWDGNNSQIDLFQYYDIEDVIIIRREDRESNPKYSFSYDIVMKDGEIVECQKSNESGSISPYYVEYVNYY